MNEITSRPKNQAAAARIAIAPLDDVSTFKDRAYAALKDVIVSLDVYDGPNEVRLDERRLAQDLGVSRTPVREADRQVWCRHRAVRRTAGMARSALRWRLR